MTADSPWRISWHDLPRAHAAALVLASMLALLFLSASTQLGGEEKDGLTNLQAGIVLAETGVLGPQEKARGWHRREPMLPFAIAGYHLARKAVGLPVLGFDCLPPEAQETAGCKELTAPYRAVNAAFLVLAAACAFLLVFRGTGSAAASFAAFGLTAGSAALIDGTHRMLTEAPAAAFMALSAVFLQAVLARRRAWLAAGLGASIAGLVLTKVVFAQFWILAGATFAVLALTAREHRRRLLALAGVAFAGYAVLVGAYMTRNWVQAGTFEIGEGRAYRVLSVRASYNGMRMDEYWAGFVLATPLFSPKAVVAMGFAENSIARFDNANPDGFRRAGQANYHALRDAMMAEAAAAGRPRPGEGEVSRALSPVFRSQILADPVAHLRVTVLLAYAATFPERGLGVIRRPPEEGNLAGRWGFELPRPAWRFGPLTETVLNAATTLAVLVLPVAAWLRRRDVAGLVIALPVLYGHGVYAVASHFIPRYAIPEIPNRNAALCVLAFVLVAAVAAAVRRDRPGPAGGQVPAEAA